MSVRELKALRESRRSPPKKQSCLHSGATNFCATMDEKQEREQLEALMAGLQTENTELTQASTKKEDQLNVLHAELADALVTVHV